MGKSYADIAAEMNRGIMKLRPSVPDAMSGFSMLSKGALKAGVLSEVQKEGSAQYEEITAATAVAAIAAGAT